MLLATRSERSRPRTVYYCSSDKGYVHSYIPERKSIAWPHRLPHYFDFLPLSTIAGANMEGVMCIQFDFKLIARGEAFDSPVWWCSTCRESEASLASWQELRQMRSKGGSKSMRNEIVSPPLHFVKSRHTWAWSTSSHWINSQLRSPQKKRISSGAVALARCCYRAERASSHRAVGRSGDCQTAMSFVCLCRISSKSFGNVEF